MLHKKRDAHLYIIFKYLRLFFIVFFSFFITQGNSKNMLNYFCLKSHFFVLFGLIFVRGSNQREGRGGVIDVIKSLFVLHVLHYSIG